MVFNFGSVMNFPRVPSVSARVSIGWSIAICSSSLKELCNLKKISLASSPNKFGLLDKPQGVYDATSSPWKYNTDALLPSLWGFN